MGHYSRLQKIVIDVPEADMERTVEFWQHATGTHFTQLYEDFPEYRGGELPYDRDVTLLVQRLGEGSARVHLDVHTDDLEAEVGRLEKLGATRVRRVDTWWVMRDPAGLPFCVLPVSAGSLSEANAVRWE